MLFGSSAGGPCYPGVRQRCARTTDVVFGTGAPRSGVRAPCAEWHLARARAEHQHRTRIAVGTRGHLLEVPADGVRIRGAADMYTSRVGVGSVSLVCAVCNAVSLRTQQPVPRWHRRCGTRASGSTRDHLFGASKLSTPPTCIPTSCGRATTCSSSRPSICSCAAPSCWHSTNQRFRRLSSMCQRRQMKKADSKLHWISPGCP